jgi:predicted phage-related endonuclease
MEKYELRITPKKEHGSLDWLLERWRDEFGRCTFGASDAGALVGISKWKSRADLYFEKATAPIVVEPNNAMRWGNLVEPILLGEASRLLRVALFTPDVVYRRQRFSGSLDGVDNTKAPTLVVEAKHTSRYAIRDVEDFPKEWLAQGEIERFLTAAPVFFIVHDSRDNIGLFELPKNDALLDSLLTEAERLGSLVDNDEPYNGDLDEFDSEQVSRLFPSRGTKIELPSSVVDLLDELDHARAMAREAETVEKHTKDALARLLLDNDEGTLNGVRVISWKEQEGRKSLDAKRLQEELPDVFEKYQKESKPFRVMRTYRKGEGK